MQISIQDWKERDLLPLVNNEVDLVVINDAPTCQVELYNLCLL